MKVKTFFIFFLLSNFAYASEGQWSGAIGVEHISSIFDGKPFNSDIETSIDMLYAGVRYKKDGWRAEFMISDVVSPRTKFQWCESTSTTYNIQQTVHTTTSCDKYKGDMFGSNPRAIFRIEREWTFE